jgi:signal transduction histidine kinase
VTVDIERDERALRLAITNSAPSPAIQEPLTRLREIDRIGHGIAGMRERITLLGGSLAAGPMADGGYAVAATLPLARR